MGAKEPTWLTWAARLFFAVIVTAIIFLAIATRGLHSQDLNRARVESFRWDNAAQTLAWTVSVGEMGADREYHPTGESLEFSVNTEEGTITTGGSTYRLNDQSADHVANTITHLLTDMLDLAEPAIIGRRHEQIVEVKGMK